MTSAERPSTSGPDHLREDHAHDARLGDEFLENASWTMTWKSMFLAVVLALIAWGLILYALYGLYQIPEMFRR